MKELPEELTVELLSDVVNNNPVIFHLPCYYSGGIKVYSSVNVIYFNIEPGINTIEFTYKYDGINYDIGRNLISSRSINLDTLTRLIREYIYKQSYVLNMFNSTSVQGFAGNISNGAFDKKIIAPTELEFALNALVFIKSLQSNNTSGYKGAIYLKRDNKWEARIKIDGKVNYLDRLDINYKKILELILEIDIVSCDLNEWEYPLVKIQEFSIHMQNGEHQRVPTDVVTRLMKEWVIGQDMFNIISGVSLTHENELCPNDKLFHCGVQLKLGQLHTKFEALSEFEAVLKATHWVAKEKGLIDE